MLVIDFHTVLCTVYSTSTKLVPFTQKGIPPF